MKTQFTTERALVLVSRLRLLFAIAGVAWLFGFSPAAGGRIVAGLIVGLVLVLDVLAGATAEPKVAVAPRRKPGGAA